MDEIQIKFREFLDSSPTWLCVIVLICLFALCIVIGLFIPGLVIIWGLNTLFGKTLIELTIINCVAVSLLVGILRSIFSRTVKTTES
jgi:hypothetical protein